MTDPFEEFEFRPLTEGLGFHQKNTKSSIPNAPASNSFNLRQSLPEIQMPLSTLQRPATPAATPRVPTTTVDDILKTLKAQKRPEFDLAAETPQTMYRSSYPDLSSFILDAMLVVASTLACLIVLLMVTKVDLFAVLTNTDLSAPAALLMLGAGITWIYLVMNRIFLGFTPGEWVFDQRVGLPQTQGSAAYSLRVVLRSTLIIVTGLFVLPIFSLLLRRDLSGQWSGAPLLKKV